MLIIQGAWFDVYDNLVTYNLEVGDVKNAAEIDTKNTAI